MVDIYSYEKPWIAQRADPFVVRAKDGFYYFTASLPEFDGIAIRRGRTLSELSDAPERLIWKKHEEGPMSENVWAPEMHYLDGSWYIYFAASDKADIWALRPYVLRCEGSDPMTDQWVECGPMQCSDEDEFSFRAFSLDSTVFEVQGDRYYVWAEKVGVGKQISNLYIAKMESPTKLSTVQVMLTTPDYDWERHGFWVNEAPGVLFHGGRIYLTFSASDTSAAYCVGMLSASADADLLDPRSWTKYRQPVLSTCEEKGIYGPGHNSFTVDEEGRPVMVFHARSGAGTTGNPLFDGARHAMLMHVKFHEDGTPYFPLEG